MTTLPQDRILKAAAARRAGVTPPTIARWIATGLIPGWRVGGRIYVSAADIDRVCAGIPIPVTATS